MLVRHRYLVVILASVLFAECSHALGFADGRPIRGFDWPGMAFGIMGACAAAGWVLHWERELREQERRKTFGIYPRF